MKLIDCFFLKMKWMKSGLLFRDPQIKYRRGKSRLTHPDFLNRYKNILKSSAIVHLKTDSEFLHGYTLGMFKVLADRDSYCIDIFMVLQNMNQIHFT